MKMTKQRIIMLVLLILLVISIGYIVNDKYQTKKQEEQLTIFQQGAQYGYQQAVLQVAQQAATCQQVPLQIQNQTINMIAVECLK